MFNAHIKNLKRFPSFVHTKRHDEPNQKVENFDSTEDWETSEEAKGASDKTQRWLNCHLLWKFFLQKPSESLRSMCYLDIPLDLIKGGRVKEDVNKDQVRVFFHISIVV